MNTTFTTYAEKKAKQFLNLLQGYTKGIRITAILILLLMGVSNAGATDFQGQGTNAGWISGDSDEGLILTWSKNSSTATTKMKYKSLSSGRNLGSITTGLKLTKIEAKFWRVYAYGNICGATIFWELYKGDTKIANDFEDCTSWGSWSGNNCTLSKDLNLDLLAKTTGPGAYTIKVYGKLTGRSQNNKYDDPSYLGCSDNFWYNNNNTGSYSITFTIDPVVTFKANGGTGNDYTQTVTYNTSTALTANKFTRTGYSFSGWKTAANSGTSYADKANVTFKANTTLYAQWTAKQYNITYKDQGNVAFSGTHESGYPTTHTYGTATTLKTASKDGYTFGGWFTDSGCTGSTVTSLGATEYTANITLYAKWTEKTYSLTFKHDGHGTIKVGGTIVNSGSTASVNHVNTKTLVATPNTGYNFSSWALSGSNTNAVTIGNTSAASTTIKATNTGATVTANFTPKTYTITLNANGGASNGSATATYNSNIVTNATYPTRTNYRCIGYYTATSGGTLVLNTDGTLKANVSGYTDANGNWTKDGTATLYAHWEAIEETYTITIKANGNGTVSTESVIVNKSITAEVTATPNEGYKFIGWETEGGAEVEVADKDPVSTANASSTTVTAVATGSVTANFEALLPNTLTLTQQPMYKERPNPIDGVPGCDGTEANPYKIYSEEFVRITAAALPEVEGLTAYYKFGDKEQVENVFDFSEISGTTPSKITVKAYYKKDATVWGSELTTDSYYFLRIPLPYYVSTSPATEMSLDRVAAGEDITVQFRSDDKTTVNLYVQTGDNVNTKEHLVRIENSASYDYHYVVQDNINPCVLRFIAESDGLHNGRSFSKYAEVALYKNVVVKVNDPNSLLRKVYMWRGEDVKTQWPGEDFIKTFGTWRIFTVKYPYYDHFILNDGTNDNQTFDYEIPSEDKCYQLSENKVTDGGYTNYQLAETDCPSNLLVGDIEAVTVGVGEQKVVIPAVEVGVGYQISDLVTTVISSNTSKATAIVSGKNIIVTGKATGTATITVTYTLGETTVTETFNVTVAAATSVTIQVKVPTEHGPEADRIGWWENDKVYVRYWNKENNGADIKMTHLTTTDYHYYFEAIVPLDSEGKTNFNVFYDNRNEDWRYSTNATNVTEDGCYLVYNDGKGDRGLKREGVRCLTDYQVKTLMQSGKEFTSNIVADADGIMSFFAPGKDETGRKAGAVMLYCNGSVVAAIAPATFETSTVYTATINDEGNGLANVAPYTGNYYIRTWGKDNDISNKGTQSVSTWTAAEKSSRSMTFFISREGEYYNHYWVQAMEPHNGGKDVSAWVANDYNDDLAGKLTGDKNTNENGDIKFDNTMNVRFGYDPRTNYFGRAILRGSGQNQDYLNLHCNNAYSDANCTTKLPYGTSNTDNKFRDISNWVYEREVYVKIDNNNPTASMYIEALSPRNDAKVKNHLLGYVINEATGAETSTPIQKIVIASGTDNGVYKIRVVYDFKTNRMISVWEPNGDIEVNTKKTLKTDILFLRKENNPAPQITLTGDGRINSIQSVFFALELQRGDADKANRHEEQYMFTLPFDCVVGSISGVPGYMEVWGIQRYRGDLRAQKGWFIETPTFWEWMSLTDTLKAGEGYLLAFDKKNAHWEEFLEEDLVTKTSLLRLYFPSIQKGFDLQQQSEEELTRTYENHTCTLTLHDRYKYDSNWKMIGTTSYNNATVTGYVKDDDPEYEELEGGDAPRFRYKYSYTFDNNNNRTSYNYDPELGSGDDVVYQSFYGYMVQFAGTITWSPINETVPEPLAAPRRAQAARSTVTMRLELANIDLEKQDQTFVALDEKGTTSFDQNKDLNKVFNSGKANIYTLSEGIPFAGNTLPMEEAVVPVGVDIATAGEYTFRMPDGTEGMVVELVDYETNTRTNLLLSDYIVTLPKGTSENRFALHIQPQKDVVTSLENIGEGVNNGEAVNKYLIDGRLYLKKGSVLYDAQGRKL